jgi:hypothetical protein
MRTLRTRLTLIFVAATAVPLAATLWMSSSLLERSLSYSSIERLDSTSRSLHDAGREYYGAAREALKADAEAGRLRPTTVAPTDFDTEEQDFWTSSESERFALAGNKLFLFRREPGGIDVFVKPLSLDLGRVSSEFRDARAVVDAGRSRDLRRGFNATLLLITVCIWLASFWHSGVRGPPREQADPRPGLRPQ